MGLRLWGLSHGQLRSGHTHPLFNLLQGFLCFPTLFYFSDVQDDSTPGPVAVCCSTQYQTDSSKAAFFCCVPFGYSMLVPPLSHFGLHLALRCPESLFLGIYLFTPGDRLFIGSKGPFQASKVPKVAVLHLQEKHKHTLIPTLAWTRSFSCYSTLGFTPLSFGDQHHSIQ